MLPQVKFLKFITQEAQKYPHFHLVIGANVQELIEENGVIQGVRYQGQGGSDAILLAYTTAYRFNRIHVET